MIHSALEITHFCKVGWTEEIAYGLNSAGNVQVRSFVELIYIPSSAQKGDQMAACGCSPYTDSIWIDVILGCVGSEEADSSFAVFDLCRKDCMLAESVVDARGGIALS